jgi:enoyl-CoA hydratase/carnithine racemase
LRVALSGDYGIAWLLTRLVGTARAQEAERLIRLTMTSDHREAVQAFIDKRKAVFKGK